MFPVQPAVSYSFPREARLTQAAEFQRVLQAGKRLQATGLSMRVLPNQLGRARLGMAIAKKALRRAHERNRLRRLIRESFRQQRHALPAVDVVLLCRPDVLAMSNAALFQQLEGLWLRVHQLYSAHS